MTRLKNGQSFPALDVPAVGGGTIHIPQSLQGSYGVVLIYRGGWCPYCQAQLAGFQRASEKLAATGILGSECSGVAGVLSLPAVRSGG
jgi:peroxiredoxin